MFFDARTNTLCFCSESLRLLTLNHSVRSSFRADKNKVQFAMWLWTSLTPRSDSCPVRTEHTHPRPADRCAHNDVQSELSRLSTPLFPKTVNGIDGVPDHSNRCALFFFFFDQGPWRVALKQSFGPWFGGELMPLFCPSF